MTPEPSSPIADLDRRILLERDGLIVVDKPPHLPTSGRTLEDADCVQFWLMRRARRMVWAVHQLDADTSGLNIFVSRKSLVPAWQRRTRFPNARKSYLAIAHGAPDWDQRRLSAPIGFVETPARRSWAVVDSGKHAATRFEVLSRSADGKTCALRATLETGRTHQIRVHLQHLGLSLIGEEWYRDEPCTRRRSCSATPRSPSACTRRRRRTSGSSPPTSVWNWAASSVRMTCATPT